MSILTVSVAAGSTNSCDSPFQIAFLLVFLLIFEWVMCFFADLQNLCTRLFLACLVLFPLVPAVNIYWGFEAFVTQVTSMYNVTFIF